MLGEPKWSIPEAPPTNSWEYQTYAAFLKGSFLRARWELSFAADQGLVLALRSVPQYAWVPVNGKIIGEHAGDLSLAGGIDFSSFVLDDYLGPEPLRLEITFYGETTRDLGNHVTLISYLKAQRLTRWTFCPWKQPSSEGRSMQGYPAWWEIETPRPSRNEPFFFVTQGLSKGQAYLNGRALGRYGEIGPQHSLCVPEPWFAEHNVLAVFDEEGKNPQETYLMQDGRLSARKVWL